MKSALVHVALASLAVASARCTPQRDATPHAEVRGALGVALEVPRAAGPVDLGGSLAEFAAAPAVTVMAGSATATFRLLWDDTYLYVSAQVTDPDLRDNGSGEDGALWGADGIEVLLDPLRKRTASPDATFRHVILSGDGDKYDATGAAGAGGSATYDFPGPFAWQAVSTGTFGGGAADTGYQVAARLPWSALGVTPTNGLVLGADLAVNDLAASGLATKDWGDLAGYAQPSLWNDLVLVQSPSTVDVPRAAGAVNLGGSLAEFDAAPPVTVTTGSATATFRLLWDDTYLYVSARVADTDLRDNGSGEDGALWEADGVEILLDPLRKRTPTPDTTFRHVILSADGDKYDATGAGGSGGSATYDFPAPFAWQAVANGTFNGGAADTGYQVAVRLPWSALGVTPASGVVLGADLALNALTGSSLATKDWANLAGYAQPSRWNELRLTSAAGPLFSDGFDRTTGLGPNWRVWSGSFTTDGALAVSGPQTASGDGNWASVVPALGTNDYAVQADVLIPAGSLYSGIFARKTDSLNVLDASLYAAQLSSSGDVNLYRRSARSWQLLGSAPAGIQPNTRYGLKLVTTGSPTVHLEVWVNGALLLARDDPSGLAAGVPGILNWDGNVRYDAFAVTAASGPPAPPGGGRPSGLVSVVDHGAVGDGITDDTAAFQAATATGAGVWVPRPPAFYKVTAPIHLRASIIGDHSDLGNLPTIRMYGATGEGFHPTLVVRGYHGAAQLVIAGLQIDNQYVNATTGGEWDHNIAISDSDNVRVTTNRLLNAWGDGVCIGEWKRAPSDPELDCRNILVDNNYIYNPFRCTVAPLFTSAGTVIRNNYHHKINRWDNGVHIPPIDLEPDAGPQLAVAWDVLIEDNVVDTHSSDGANLDFIWQDERFSWAPDPVRGTRARNNRGYWGALSNSLLAEDTNNVFMDPPPPWTMQPFSP